MFNKDIIKSCATALFFFVCGIVFGVTVLSNKQIITKEVKVYDLTQEFHIMRAYAKMIGYELVELGRGDWASGYDSGYKDAIKNMKSRIATQY